MTFSVSWSDRHRRSTESQHFRYNVFRLRRPSEDVLGYLLFGLSGADKRDFLFTLYYTIDCFFSLVSFFSPSSLHFKVLPLAQSLIGILFWAISFTAFVCHASKGPFFHCGLVFGGRTTYWSLLFSLTSLLQRQKANLGVFPRQSERRTKGNSKSKKPLP